MKKGVGIVLAIIVIALIAYFAFGRKGSDTTEQSNTTSSSQSSDQSSNSTKTSSLKSLISSGNQSCTYNDGQTTGVVYTANGKARMDFTSTTNGVSTASHSVIDGDIYYSWIDGQPSGFKFSMNQSTTGSAGSNQNVDVNKETNYNCSSWSPDNSKFVLPTGVTFTDLSKLQTGM